MIKKIYLNTITNAEVLDRLANGEAIFEKRQDILFRYHMYKGILTRHSSESKELLVNPAFFAGDCNMYFEDVTDEPLISEPGLYKTKSGKKVFVSDIIEHASVCHGIIEGTCKATTWYLNGQRHKTYTTDDDIVDVWKDDND